jgi:hypothetical protein
VLSIVGRSQGTVFEVNQVTTVTYDEPIEDALFTYAPRDGEQVVSEPQVVERLSLEAAKQRMPFTILVPSQLPDAAHGHLEVMYHPPRIRSPRPYLHLVYQFGFDTARDERNCSIWMEQSITPSPQMNEFEWERVEHQGKAFRISDPGATGMRMVALEHSGTHVVITSQLDREELLDLASSLVSA